MHAVLRRALADAVRDELVSRNVALLVSGQGAAATRGAGDRHRAAGAARGGRGRPAARPVARPDLARTPARRGAGFALERHRPRRRDAGRPRVTAAATHLRGSAVRPAAQHALVEVDPKTEGSVRTLALPDVLVEALRQQRRVQTAERLAARTWVDASLGFTTSVGTALEPRNVSRSRERVCERAGLDRHLRIHDLRHAAASFLLLQGADLRTVMEQLGHSRLATTSDVYVHVLDQVKRDAASRMAGFLRTIAGP